jgi:ABC-type dipeptide/oligopeptide/nickel transport system permease component
MKLRDFIIRRLLLMIPVIFGVLVFSFLLSHAIGDPAAAYTSERMTEAQIAAIRARYHFDQPLVIQFWYYLAGLLQGDLGWSRSANMPTTQAIAVFFPATMELSMVAIIIGLAMGIPLGIKSAIKKDQPVDHVLRVFSLGGVSMPIFWFALMLQLFLYYELQSHGLPYFPLLSRGSDATLTFFATHRITGLYLIDSLLWLRFDLFLDSLWHIILPAFCLAYLMLATISRMMRSSMLEVMRQDYITLARSKGLSERVVIYKHAMRNALIPTVTVTGLAFGGLLTGAVLTESVFAWPGIGRWSTLAMLSMDLGGIMGFVLLSGIVYSFANLIVDILYAFIDPRVRYG